MNIIKDKSCFLGFSPGIRTKKIRPSETTTFELEGSNIISMNKETSTENVRLDFVYDASATLIGVNTIEGHYFYIRDITCNILGLIDNEGNYIVKYKYDAWGKVLEKKILKSCIASRHNPFVYKGYFLDEETGFYYLKSRYYDPKVGRFINYAPVESLNLYSKDLLNLYALPGNNPLSFSPKRANIYNSESGFETTFANSDVSGVSGGNFLLANHIYKTHQSFKLINNAFVAGVFGNASYNITQADKSPGLFYSYSDFGIDGAQFGVGINIGGWIGAEVFVATPFEIGGNVQITPWLHAGGQIGLSGIGLSLGIDIDNKSHGISINIGWGTVGLVALACTPLPGTRAAAAAAAVILFFVGLFGKGNPTYYF